jgi:hypothetical protein
VGKPSVLLIIFECTKESTLESSPVCVSHVEKLTFKRFTLKDIKKVIMEETMYLEVTWESLQFF